MAWIARALFYPTLWWNKLLLRFTRRNWWDWVDDTILLGALPRERDVALLKAQGIGGVINTCLESPPPEAAYRAAGIDLLSLPIVDFTQPRLGDIHKALEFIRDEASRGRKVYVHCKAGRGRSATIVLCYLIQKGMSPEAAQKLLLEKRPHVLSALHQREVVQKFREEMRAGQPGPISER